MTIWAAADLGGAIVLAEEEAKSYAASNGLHYLGYVQVYAIPSAELDVGIEVFSLIRESNLEPDEYLTSFFDTGRERQRYVD